jgi:hypothetical protein
MSKTYRKFMKNKFEKSKTNKYKKQRQKFKEGESNVEEEFEELRAMQKENESDKHL